MIKNVYVFNPVRTDYINKALETLYEYTDMEKNRVIVVDQTKKGLVFPKGKVHLHIRPHRNLGFAKSMNEGIIHGMHWKSEYITCSNDDIEWMNSRWWGGIEETFNQDERIMAVNPMSPKEPGWGYGLPHGEYLHLMQYKEKFTEEDYDWLLAGDFSKVEGLPKSFPKEKKGVIDAIATWCTVFKRKCFENIGLFDELFYPGGAEDYDYNARVYRKKLRMVGTTRSWVWHHWGSSKDKQNELEEGLPIVEELRWQDSSWLWPDHLNGEQQMDPWGHWTDKDGEKHPMSRVEKIHVVDI